MISLNSIAQPTIGTTSFSFGADVGLASGDGSTTVTATDIGSTGWDMTATMSSGNSSAHILRGGNNEGVSGTAAVLYFNVAAAASAISFHSGDGSEFDLNSFGLNSTQAATNYTVTGHRDGADVTGASLSGSVAQSALGGAFTTIDLSGDDDFNNIDGFTITFASPQLRFIFDDISISAASPLPINLLDFQAKRKGEAIKLNWTTALEQNNKGFEIEQSLDGEAFKQIGFVDGVGNSIEEQTYEYTLRSMDAAYYRFKQIDLDGKYSYSPTRFIAAWGAAEEAFIYPNPVDREIFINHLSDEQTLSLDIFDIQGKKLAMMKGRKLELEQQLSEKFEGFSKGIYFVYILSSGKSSFQKVIKE